VAWLKGHEAATKAREPPTPTRPRASFEATAWTIPRRCVGAGGAVAARWWARVACGSSPSCCGVGVDQLAGQPRYDV